MLLVITTLTVGGYRLLGGASITFLQALYMAVITLGVECTAAGVGGLYGARSTGGLLDGWLVDDADAGTAVPGVTVYARPLWMTDPDATAHIVECALDVAGVRGE